MNTYISNQNMFGYDKHNVAHEHSMIKGVHNELLAGRKDKIQHRIRRYLMLNSVMSWITLT